MRGLLFGVAFAASGCASWGGPVPGPTKEGVAVAVKSRERGAARREALESMLPLFMTRAARLEKAALLEPVFSHPGSFIGRERLSNKGPGAVEVRIDALSAALRKTGAVVPPGYETGSDVVLIAFGDRSIGPDGQEQAAADAFEVALFGRGIQAKDADDRLSPISPPLKGRGEAEAVASAARGPWGWMTAGRVGSYAHREPESGGWKAGARLNVALYELGGSTEPARVETSGDVIDVSSAAAVTRALEEAAQEAAARVEGKIVASRRGRATIGVLVSGRKDPAFLLRLIGDLRRVPDVIGASLVSWDSLDSMALIHAYSAGPKVDVLAAYLLRADPSLRLGAIETDSGRLTVEGPEIAPSQDRGWP